jgi:PAS domain S-box-containing protein/putative nucleotidyltransferase with HDIG domain
MLGALELGFEVLSRTLLAGYATPVSPVLLVGYILVLATFWMNRKGRLKTAAWITVTIMSIIIFGIAFDQNGDPATIYFLDYLFFPLMVAGIFLPAWSLWVVVGASFIGMGLAAWMIRGLEFETLLMGPAFYTVVTAGVIALYNHHRAALERDRQRDLTTREQRYRALFEGANDGIFLIDSNQHFVAVNNKAAELLGYTLAELQDKTTMDIIAAGDQVATFRLSQMLQAGQEVGVFESRFRRKHGATFPGEVTPAVVRGPDGQMAYIQYIVRDISERKAAEARLQQQVRRLNALRRIDRMVAGGRALTDTLETLLTETSNQLAAPATAALLIDPATGCLAPAAIHGLSANAVAALGAAMGALPQAWSTTEGRALRLPDGSYAAPLSVKGALKGALWAAYTPPAPAAEAEAPEVSLPEAPADWVEFLEMLAGQAAIAVDSAEMHLGLQRSHAELLASYEATLEGWARALELRDNETQGHSRRVTTLAVDLARVLGMSEPELVHFRRGALLHDIGKMGIPDRILLKEEKLTEAEWKIMRQHPNYAHDMLQPIKYLRKSLDIPYCHHEKWDGTGYPRGLKGEQIPLVARIFAIIDVWDAVTIDRPYRKAWTKQKALKYIREQSGKHFDPVIVAAFLEIFDKKESPASTGKTKKRPPNT